MEKKVVGLFEIGLARFGIQPTERCLNPFFWGQHLISMNKVSPKIESAKKLLARIKKEMAKPRVAKSARELSSKTEVWINPKAQGALTAAAESILRDAIGDRPGEWNIFILDMYPLTEYVVTIEGPKEFFFRKNFQGSRQQKLEFIRDSILNALPHSSGRFHSQDSTQVKNNPLATHFQTETRPVLS